MEHATEGEKRDLARQILEILDAGYEPPEASVFQLRAWAGPEGAMRPLRDIACGILGLEGRREPK